MTETGSIETIIVALNRLDADSKNVRKAYTENGIQVLVARNKPKGLSQNPAVRSRERKSAISSSLERDAWRRSACLLR